jgi:CheY-like chemotaxis protein
MNLFNSLKTKLPSSLWQTNQSDPKLQTYGGGSQCGWLVLCRPEAVMSKKVLIVEDYADVRAIMKILVHRYGYEVIEAEDGYEAIEQTQKHSPDLILMDLAMPLMDGITATKLIRSLRDFADLPIIALSAYGDTRENIAIQAGINQVICKPVDFDTLQPLLNQYLH